MNIKNLADLSKIADICRKKGIETIKITAESIEFKLSEQLVKPKRNSKAQDNSPDIGSGMLSGPTEEELLFWSSGGVSDLPTGGQG